MRPLPLLALCVVALSACSESSPPQPTGEISAEAPFSAFEAWRTRHLQAPAQGSLSEGVALARARAEAMRQLIETAPEEAVRRAAPFHWQGLPLEISSQLERWVDGRGTLAVVAAGPDEEECELERFVQLDGKVYRAFVYGRREHAISAVDIPLHGVLLDGRIAVSDSPLRTLLPKEPVAEGVPLKPSQALCEDPELVHGGDAVYEVCGDAERSALATELSEGDGTEPPASAWTEGPKDLLVIRVDFSDMAGDPVSEATIKGTLDGAVNTFYVEASYGKTSFSSSVVTPTLRMPRTKADYLATGDYQGLMSDARAAARTAGFDTAGYDLDLIAFDRIFSGWSGRGWVGSKGTWLNGSFTFRTIAHELGHNYGLYHANYWSAPGGTIIGPGSSQEYGNPFDVMGGGSSKSYHYTSWAKSRLNWVVPGEVQTVTASGTYRVHALEEAIASGLHALKLRRPDGAKDYWVEHRRALTSNTYLQNGVSMVWGFAYNTESQLLDMTPGSAPGKTDSPLVIGRTFSDSYAGIHVTPIALGGTAPESIDVVVNLGAFSGNAAPTVTVSADVTSAATGAPINFTATASDPDGDTLAYAWSFGNDSFGPNAATATKSYSIAGEYVVRCTVSDMKGRVATDSVIVTIGAPSANHRLSGTVSFGGAPLEGVRISDGTRLSYTDSDGTYTLVNVPAGSYTLSAVKAGYTFTRGFSSPVAVAGSMTGLDFTGAQATYRISGTVNGPSGGLEGVTVSDGTRTAVTNASGNFTLLGVPEGAYTLTAAKPGWMLIPSGWNNPREVYGGDVTGVLFSYGGYSISGRILNVNASVQVTDGLRTTTSYKQGPNWTYSLSGVPNGTWTLTASAPGLTLTPDNFTNPVIVSNSAVSGKDFTASGTATFTVSGAITAGTLPLPGVQVSDGTRTATSDSLGAYTLTGVPAGSYTLTPSLTGTSFTPATRSITVVDANLRGQDFTTATADVPPWVSQPAAATPPTVSGVSTQLSVLGADDGGEASLVYTWSSVSGPAAVAFSVNGSNAAKGSTATFSRAGTYVLQVVIRDASGQTATSQVTVTVVAVPTALAVAPPTASVSVGSSQQFTVSAVDQFGDSMSPPSVTWSVSGGGSVSSTGLFTAGAAPGGPFTVSASASGGGTGPTASALVTVTPATTPTVAVAAYASPNPVTGTTTTLSVLGADDGGEAALVYTWSAVTAPAPVAFSVNGSNAAKSTLATFIQAGDYRFEVELRDANGELATSSVDVLVEPTLTTVAVSPAVVAIQPGATQQFNATLADQFGEAPVPAPSVFWSVSGGGSIDGAGLFTADLAPGGPFTVTASLGAVSGTAELNITAEVIDSSPPTVSISSPSVGATVSGSIQVLAEATDNVGVVRVSLHVDDALLGQVATAPYELSLDTSTLSNGAHEAWATAFDAAGNQATSERVAFSVQNSSADAPPTVELIAPAEGAELSGAVELIASVSDDLGVASVAFELDGERLGQADAAPYQLLVDTERWSTGTHVLAAVATDSAGQVSRSAPVSVLIKRGQASGGCGCTSGGELSPLLALALFGVRRRRR